MLKHRWHVVGMLIVLIFCYLCESHARSSTFSTYQHLNGINRADIATHQFASDANTSNNFNTNDVDVNENESVASAATSTTAGKTGFWQDLSLIYRIYQQCSHENLSVCLKVKLLTGLEKVLRSSKSLPIIDGVQFVHSSGNHEASKQLPSEQEIEAALPRSLEAKELVLNNLIFKKLASFFRDHTLQVKFPDVRSWHDISDNLVEGRGKKKDKKGGGAYIMIPLLLGGTFVPIAYGALAMLAGKALIVSKLALVLASIIGIKKLLSGENKKEAHEVVVSSGHSGWGRDIDLAYNGWKPKQNQNQNQADDVS